MRKSSKRIIVTFSSIQDEDGLDMNKTKTGTNVPDSKDRSHCSCHMKVKHTDTIVGHTG